MKTRTPNADQVDLHLHRALDATDFAAVPTLLSEPLTARSAGRPASYRLRGVLAVVIASRWRRVSRSTRSVAYAFNWGLSQDQLEWIGMGDFGTPKRHAMLSATHPPHELTGPATTEALAIWHGEMARCRQAIVRSIDAVALDLRDHPVSSTPEAPTALILSFYNGRTHS